jgi:hypothetical protein
MILKSIKDVVQGKANIRTPRSSKWTAVRKEHLKNNPICTVCGGKEKLEVHHIKPFYKNPELELEPSNLITLCESRSHGVVCHLFFGHLGSYKNINPDVIEDVKHWNNKLSIKQ